MEELQLVRVQALVHVRVRAEVDAVADEDDRLEDGHEDDGRLARAEDGERHDDERGQARVEFQSEVEGAQEIVRREVMAERGQKRQPQQHEDDDVAREDEQSAADHPEKLGATVVMNASMFCITCFESWLLKSNQSIKRSSG